MEDEWHNLCKDNLGVLSFIFGQKDAFAIMLGVNRLPSIVKKKDKPFTTVDFSNLEKLVGGFEGDYQKFEDLLSEKDLHRQIKCELDKALSQRWVPECNQITLKQVALCKSSMYHGQATMVNDNLVPIQQNKEILTYWAEQNVLTNSTLFSRLVRTFWYYQTYIEDRQNCPNVVHDIVTSVFFNFDLMQPKHRKFYYSFIKWVMNHQFKFIEDFFILEPIFQLEVKNRCLLVNCKSFCDQVLPEKKRIEKFEKIDLTAYLTEDTPLLTESYTATEKDPLSSSKLVMGEGEIVPLDEFTINKDEQCNNFNNSFYNKLELSKTDQHVECKDQKSEPSCQQSDYLKQYTAFLSSCKENKDPLLLDKENIENENDSNKEATEKISETTKAESPVVKRQLRSSKKKPQINNIISKKLSKLKSADKTVKDAMRRESMSLANNQANNSIDSWSSDFDLHLSDSEDEEDPSPSKNNSDSSSGFFSCSSQELLCDDKIDATSPNCNELNSSLDSFVTCSGELASNGKRANESPNSRSGSYSILNKAFSAMTDKSSSDLAKNNREMTKISSGKVLQTPLRDISNNSSLDKILVSPEIRSKLLNDCKVVLYRNLDKTYSRSNTIKSTPRLNKNSNSSKKNSAPQATKRLPLKRRVSDVSLEKTSARKTRHVRH